MVGTLRVFLPSLAAPAPVAALKTPPRPDSVNEDGRHNTTHNVFIIYYYKLNIQHVRSICISGRISPICLMSCACTIDVMLRFSNIANVDITLHIC